MKSTYRYGAKRCAECKRSFHPTGSRSKYCDTCRPKPKKTLLNPRKPKRQISESPTADLPEKYQRSKIDPPEKFATVVKLIERESDHARAVGLVDYANDLQWFSNQVRQGLNPDDFRTAQLRAFGFAFKADGGKVKGAAS